MAQLAVVMVLSCHVKNDIECLDTTCTLLEVWSKFVLIEEINDEIREDAYLYYDTNDSKWIRSGKVTGRPFIDRHKEHKKHASCRHATSLFYIRYPAKSNQFAKSSSRKGFFENPQQYIALGFDAQKEYSVKTMTSDVSNGGIFSFEEIEIRKMSEINMRGRHTKEAKMIDMIAYLAELAYDLAICSVDNISSNPGFESILGVW